MLAAMLIVMSGVDKDSVVTGARRSRQEKLHSDMADKTVTTKKLGMIDPAFPHI